MKEAPTSRAVPQVELDLAEFKRLGYLQEINRRFLHPLGLALAVERIGEELSGRVKVWDGRDDLEGFIFDELTVDDCARGELIEAELQVCLGVRQERLGFGVQPLEPRSPREEVAGQ